MLSLNSAKIKQFIKRTFPFIRHRWYIFDKLIEFSEKYNKINKLIELIGFRRFLKMLIYSQREEIMQVLDMNKVAYPISKCKLNVHSIERKHVPRLVLFRKQAKIYGIGPDVYLNNGCQGFLAELEGEIIGYAWWGDYRSNYYFDPKGTEFYIKQIALAPTYAYSFDLFVAPEYRGNGNALEFSRKYILELKALGYERIYVTVHKENIAARWIYKIVGGKDVKKIVVRRFLLFFLFKNSKYFFDDGIKWLCDERENYKVKKRLRTYKNKNIES